MGWRLSPGIGRHALPMAFALLGVLTTVADANIGSIFGIGFPPATGGPATFMTNYEGGLAGFIARAEELAAAYGPRFAPSDWLRARANEGTLA